MRRRKRPSVELMESRELLSGLTESLTTDQSTYQLGQPIHFTFTITNTSDEPANFGAGASDTAFEVSQGGQMIWQTVPGPGDSAGHRRGDLAAGTIVVNQGNVGW